MTDWIREELEELQHKGLHRILRSVSGPQGTRIILDGRECLLLCSNNYLGLADHPAVKEASIDAVTRFGASSGASRLVSGTMDLHLQLEEKLAHFKGSETALLFNCGYAANTGILQAIAGRSDSIYSDKLNHASIVDGARFSGARLTRYPHRDCDALESLMSRNSGRGRQIIVTDGVFSMDGDIAPLQRLIELKKSTGALLVVDDAHGGGVLGKHGRGTAEHLGAGDGIDILIGTLGKAFGSFGAYMAADIHIREYLVNKARSFIFSTSLPPAVLAASSAALKIIASPEGDSLRECLYANATLLRSRLSASGFSTLPGITPIIPLITGEPEITMRFSSRLFEQGIFCQGIRPPTVPAGSCRLRFTVMATHLPEELERAADIIEHTGRELGVI